MSKVRGKTGWMRGLAKMAVILAGAGYFCLEVLAVTVTQSTSTDFNAGTKARTSIILGGSGDGSVVQLTLGSAVSSYAAGSGSGGALTVSSANQVVNTYAGAGSNNYSSGATSITVDSTAGFSSGDEILIIQMSHDNASSNAGKYEFKTNITVVNSTTISFSGGLTNNYYGSGSSGKTQVVRVPQYTNVTILSGGSITASAYSESTGKGGIAVFKATGIVTVNSGGSIDVSGEGYAGGPAGAGDYAAGQGTPGESYRGLGIQANSPSANYGGGGGGWQIVSGQNAGSGAGGGYGTAGSNGASDASNLRGGIGGNTYGMSDLSLFLIGSGGGGGGAHWSASEYGGDGGAGGGGVFIFANNISVSGNIKANGTNGITPSGQHQNGGGGGSGGSIYLGANYLTIGASNVQGTGGTGGGSAGVGRPGGNGGNGRIRLDYISLSGAANPSAYNYSKIPDSGVYTSSVIDAGSSSSWDTVSWSESGVATGDGETPYDSTALAAQWKFNETSGTTAVNSGSCGANCNGALVNFASTGSQDAAVGSGWTANNRRWGAGALMFDGSNNYVGKDSGAGSASGYLGGGSAMTCSAWVKRNSNGTDDAIYYLGGGTSYGHQLLKITSSNTIRADFGNDANTDYKYLITSGTLTDTNWHYLAATYNAGTIHIYVDGIEWAGSGGGTWGGNVVLDTTYLRIGADGTTTTGSFFDGIIDSVAIYNRELSASEILSNYNAGNIEIQTRTGASSDPNDGTWEAWKPVTSETQLLSMDSDKANWSNSSSFIALSDDPLKVEGAGSLKAVLGVSPKDGNTAGLWRLDETSGTGAYIKDLSGSAQDLTPTGTTAADGFLAKARGFSGGSDEISRVWSAGTVNSVEFWVYPTSWTNANFLQLNGTTSVTAGASGQITASGWTSPSCYVNGALGTCGSTALTLNQWNYAVVTDSTAVTPVNFKIGRTTASMSGYMDEVRVSNAVRSADEIAKAYRAGRDYRLSRSITAADLSTQTKLPFYVAADRPGTYLEAAIGESPVANYEADANTVLFLHGDEILGSTSIKDSSVSGKAVTANGNVKTSGFGKIGNSVYFDGSGDYLTVPDSADWDFESGDFTFDTWINLPNVSSGTMILFHQQTASNNEYYLYQDNVNHQLHLVVDGPVFNFTGNWNPIANTWYHVALARSGNVWEFFVNGTEIASTINSQNISNKTGNLYIGRWATGGGDLNGYLDELRIIKGAARTPDQIRQAYEYGRRAHPITIDFAAKLDSANLISGSGDTSFTVDATAYGLSQKGSNLYPGDKIIVRENVNGTEYLAQGTVSVVTASTGAVTVSSWDSGSTFPFAGYSVNAGVFKWQREYFDITGIMASQRDAITNLTFRITDASLGRTIYIDDLRAGGPYLTNPAGSSLTSLANRYLQYRAIFSTTDTAVSPGLNSLTIGSNIIVYFAITHPTYSAAVGSNQTITITAKNSSGGVLTGYVPASTVSVTKSESGSVANSATLSPIALSAANFSAGAATITLSDTEAEQVTVSAVDQSNTSYSGNSLPVSFTPGAIASYAITSAGPQAAGTGWSATVSAKDQYGNTVTSASNQITVSAGGAAKLYTNNGYNIETTTYTLSAGLSTIYIKDTKSENIILTATDGSKTGTSGSINVDPAPAVKFTISGNSTQAQGASQQLTIQAYDTYNNLVSSGANNYTGDKSLTFSGANSFGASSPTVSDKSGAKINFGNSAVITFANGTASTGGSITLYKVETATISALEGSITTPAPLAVTVTSAFALTAPNGAESWRAGESRNITWTTGAGASIANVKLSYSLDGGTNYNDIITDSIVNSGSYSWTLPSFISSMVRVKVEDASGTGISDTSDANFSIIAPSLTLLTPSAGGISLSGGQSYLITWNYAGAISNNLSLYYSTDNGASYPNTIASGESNDGTYTWTVPYDPASQSKVKIKDTFYQKLLETSQAQFTGGTFSNTQVSGSGTNASATLTNLFGVSPWTTFTNVPVTVGHGGELIKGDNDTLYALGGNNSGNFLKYTISTQTWESLAPITNGTYDGSIAMVGGVIYAITGVGNTSFLKYTGGVWNNVGTTTPQNTGAGCKLLVMGNDLYIIAGGTTNYFWKYNTSTGAWTDLSPLPNTVSWGTSMVDGGNGIIYILRGNTSDFWKYDTNASANPWSILSGAPIAGALSAEDTNNFYAIDTLGTAFWKYIVSTNTWVPLSGISAPIGVRFGGALAVVGGNVYAFDDNYGTNFYKYEPAKEGAGWVSLNSVAPFTLNSWQSALVKVDNDTLYALNDANMGKYTISTNTWTTITGAPAGGPMVAAGANTFYALGGNFIRKYTISGTVCTSLDLKPTPSTTAYSAMVAVDSDTIYVTPGKYNGEFWKYSISGNSWQTLTSPWTTGHGCGLAYVNGSVYILGGNGAGFWRYIISNGNWESLAQIPKGVYAGKLIAADNDSLYAFSGNDDNEFFKYTISTNKWVGKPTALAPVKIGNALAAVDSNTIYAFRGNGTTDFWKYSTTYPASGTFTSAALDTGGNSEYGKLNWGVTVSSQSGANALKFQLAAKAADSGWVDSDFVGPDGTANSYFTTSGTDIPTSLDTKRYLKYKAYLSTADVNYTPALNDVSVTFTDNNAADSVISDVSDNPFTINPAAITTADVSLTPTNAVVGVMGNVEVSFTTVNPLPTDGKIVITFPAGFGLNSGGTTSASSTTMDGAFSVSTSGQVLTITRSAGQQQAGGQSETITLINIKNPNSVGASGTYILETQTSSGKGIDKISSIAEDTLVNGGVLTSTNVEPASLYAGAVGNVSVAFTTANPLPADGKILITFPAGFILNSGSATTASSTTMDGTLNVTISGQVVTATRSGGSQQAKGESESIILSNIKNPQPGGQTGTYQIQTTSVSGLTTGKIDEDAAVASDHIYGYLLSPVITHASKKAGAVSDTTISFTTISAIPVNGKIKVDFPVGYDLSGTLAVSGSSGATVSASNETLSINLGTAINASTAVSITVSGIKSPVLLGATGSYALQTKDTSDKLIDEGTASANTMAVPTIQLLTPSNAGITAYAGEPYNVTWSYDGGISNNLSLYYSTNGGVSYPNTIASGESNDGTYTWTVPYDPASQSKVKIEDTFYQKLLETSEAQFSGGVFSYVKVSGTGSNAGLQIDDSMFGGGSDDSFDLSLGGVSGGCSGTGMSWSGSTCTLNTAVKAEYSFTTVNIPSGTTLTATGSTFLTLRATGIVTVGGTINISGSDGASADTAAGGAGGVGGSAGGGSNGVSGSGMGGGTGSSWCGSGGGGFGGSGGAGASYCGSPAGGSAYDTTDAGGSGGGDAYCSNCGVKNGSGGGGGGSIKIAGNQIMINSGGIIKSNGGNGVYGFDRGGAGGSGGRIVLMSSIITNNGTIQAIGGVSGHGYYGSGGGGGGRVTLQDSDGIISGSGVVSVSGGAAMPADFSSGTAGSGGVYSTSVLTTTSVRIANSGIFISRSIDTGGNNAYGTFSWNAVIPAEAGSNAIKFRLAGSDNGTTWSSFVGPDGTANTYFTSSGVSTPAVLNTKRYLKYEASLTTANLSYTPILNDVSITFTGNNSADRIITDVSDNVFTITNPEITLTSPGDASVNANFRWIRGYPYNVQWKTKGKTSEDWVVECRYLSGNPLAEYITPIYSGVKSSDSYDGTYYHYSYSWAIPAAQVLTDYAYIRVSANTTDIHSAIVTDIGDSSPYFKIVAPAAIALTEPIAGTEWFINTAKDIKWNMGTPIGDVNNQTVTLQYSLDAGSTWNNISASAVNQESFSNSYSWSITKDLTGLPYNSLKLKIFDNARPETTDTTAWSFKISNPRIENVAITSKVYVGNPSGISWSNTLGVSNKVKIEYYNPSTALWNAVSESEDIANDGVVANDGSFSWTVPNIALTTQAKIRITDAAASSTAYYQASTESAAFEIAKPLYTLSGPAQSPLRRGGKYTFSWLSTGTMSTNLDALYAGSGTSFNSVKTQGSFALDYKSFTWQVPLTAAVPTSTAKFQVKDGTTPFGEGTSSAFTVDKQALFFDDSTVSGKTLVLGTSANTVGWRTEGQISTVKVEFSADGSSNWLPQTDGANTDTSGNYVNYNTSYNWSIPNNDSYLASGGKIKISAKNPLDVLINSISAGFSVREPYITVSLPVLVADSGNWVQNEALSFDWSADGGLTPGGTLQLSYANKVGSFDPKTLAEADWIQIDNVSIAISSYSWAPNLASGYTALRVKDINVNRPKSVGYSSVFQMSGEPFIVMTAPANGSFWRAGTDQVISWGKQGAVSDSLKIEYSQDGSLWSACVDASGNSAVNLSASGSFTWRVPVSLENKTINLKISDTRRIQTKMSPYEAVSVGIQGFILSDYPGKLSGEAWTAGNSWTVRWTPSVAQSAQALAKLEYSYDAAHTAWSVISESEGTANDGIVTDDGEFIWTVPDKISGTVKLRISSPAAGTVADSSDYDFKIIGGLEVSAPAAGAGWIIGTAQNITWSASAGTMSKVRLQYSPDNGVTWKSLSGVSGESTLVDNTGSYSWTVRDDYSATAKARIYEENSLSNIAESALFSINSPQITISQPSSAHTGYSSLTVNSPYDIKWSTTGSTANNLKIEVSYDGQSTWSTLYAGWPNNGLYSFTPTTTSVSSWIKISEVSSTHPAAVVTSGPFTILPTPQITINPPVSGSSWKMGRQYEIKWDTQGLVYNNLRLSYTLDGSVGSPVWVDIVSGQTNSKSFFWTVPDLTSTLANQANAKVKITDDTKGTVGYSDYFTLSIPSIAVLRPQGGEVWAVGDSAPVKWSYDGAVVGPLTLQYDAGGSVSDTSPVITGSVAKTGQTLESYSYSWSVPVGAQTSMVKVRVKDSQRPNSLGDSSASFTVISAPAINVTSPVDGDVLVIQEAVNIGWTVRGLSVGNLNIEYWDDANLNDALDTNETLYILASGVSRGTSDTADAYSGKYTGTYSLTLPDTSKVSSKLKLRLRDPSGGYTGLAAGHFRIRGGFEFRDEADSAAALAANTKWPANTNHSIKWYNKGSFANVKLEYKTSGDGINWGGYQTVNSSIVNSPDTNNISSYSWTVADPNLSLYPSEPPEFYYVKLKITDLSDTTVYAESNVFKINYYTVTWKIKDYDTLTLLDSLTVSSTYGGLNYWRVANNGLTSSSDQRYLAKTYPRRYPYGTFATFWSKDSYGDRSDSRTISADTEVTILMESAASAQTDYKVYAGFAYNEDTDTLKINSWLEKKGTLITSADTDVGLGGDGYIKLYDGETLAVTLTDSTVDSNGNYWFEALNVVKSIADGGMGLTAGKTYFAKMGIWYRSREYQSGASFEVTISKSLKAVTDEIKTMSSDIKSNVSGISSTVAAESASIKADLKSKIESASQEIGSKVTSGIGDLKSETSKILTATESTLPEKLSATMKEDVISSIKSEVKPHVRSGILNRDTTVKLDSTADISYRAESGLSPVISIYDPKNNLKISGQTMKEIGVSGVYEYNVKFLSAWGAGDFTVICSESTQGTADAAVISVIRYSMEDVAGQTSAVLGSTSGISNISSTVNSLNAQFNTLENSLSKISLDVQAKVQSVTSAAGDLDNLYNQLTNIASQIKKLGATEGMNLEKIYTVSQEKKEDINYLKNKAQELKAGMELSKKLIENVAKKPVVQTWFEYK